MTGQVSSSSHVPEHTGYNRRTPAKAAHLIANVRDPNGSCSLPRRRPGQNSPAAPKIWPLYVLLRGASPGPLLYRVYVREREIAAHGRRQAQRVPPYS